MNKTINKFLLTGDRFMPELHLKQLQTTTVVVDHSTNIAREFKNLEKQEI